MITAKQDRWKTYLRVFFVRREWGGREGGGALLSRKEKEWRKGEETSLPSGPMGERVARAEEEEGGIRPLPHLEEETED